MEPLQVSIVTFNNRATIGGCIAAVRAAAGSRPLRLRVLDNASTDGTADRLAEGYPDVELIRSPANLGFGAAHNRLLADATAAEVLLLNPDAEVGAGLPERLSSALVEDPRLALAGPRVDDPDGRPELSFGSFPSLFGDLLRRRRALAAAARHPAPTAWLERRLNAPFEPDWVSGVCWLARCAALREAGGFDERFFLYLEDVDLCRRLRARGLRVRVQPQARCTHVRGASAADAAEARRHYRRSRLLYANKHGTRLGFELYRLLRARGTGLRWNPGLRV